MTVGEKIRKIRKDKGLEIKDLATLTGLRRETLSRIETGQELNPQYATLKKIAEALGCQVYDFLSGKEYVDELVAIGAVKVLHLPQPQTEEERNYVYKLLKILRSNRERFKKSIKGLLDDFAEIEAEERQ